VSKEFRGIFLHGVGSQSKTFAHDARRLLRGKLKEHGVACHFSSVHWAPLADRAENEFLEAVKRKGSAGNMSQDLSVRTLADALMYARNPALQAEIFALIDIELAAFGKRPVTWLCHSLGGLIATDYLRARGCPAGTKMITFGCNIGLFTLGQSFEPVPGLTDWLSLWTKDDVLGFPLAIQPALAHVNDVEVTVGGLLTGWNGLSHTAYFGDHDLWAKTIPGFLGYR
jgi:hypothetical protein